MDSLPSHQPDALNPLQASVGPPLAQREDGDSQQLPHLEELLRELSQLREENKALANAVVNSIEIIEELEEVKSSLAVAQHAAEAAQHNSQKMAATIFEGTHDAMLVFAPDFKLVSANQNAREMFELDAADPDSHLMEHLTQLFHDRRKKDWFAEAVTGDNLGVRFELFRDLVVSSEEQSAAKQWIELSISRLENGEQEVNFLLTAHDISSRKVMESRFQKQAFHDNVTQLPNRRFFVQQIEQLVTSPDPELEFSVCFLDLDHFKMVNDTLGHDAGDELLIQVAQRIQSCIRSDGTTARFGGDEFALLIPNTPVETVNLIGQRIVAQLQRPFSINGNSVYIGASIGMTRFPDDAVDASQLMQNADVAMYAAKEGGRNQFRRFNKALASKINERQRLLENLRETVRQRHVNLEYQPKWNLEDNQFSGCEALLRWTSNGTPISPEILVDVAECSGLILPLGYVIFETAVKQVARWREEFDFTGKIAINISPRQLADPDLVERLCSITKKASVSPCSVELEITETAMIENFRDSFGRLRKLQEQGFSIAIDDFGTGYSSLSYLKSFPISTLKIDRSFINDIPTDPKAVAVAEAIMSLGHGLGLEVVAEGVETHEQLEFLRTVGCDQVQGYLLSRSIAGDRLSNWIAENLSGFDRSDR